MAQVNVIIGELRRPLFAESLLQTLAASTQFQVQTARAADLLRRIREAGPTVLILDAANPGIDLKALPRSASFAAILIADEGREARVLLHQIDAERIRALARFVAEAPGAGQVAERAMSWRRLQRAFARLLAPPVAAGALT